MVDITHGENDVGSQSCLALHIDIEHLSYQVAIRGDSSDLQEHALRTCQIFGGKTYALESTVERIIVEGPSLKGRVVSISRM
jgi:hypothetical protein